MQVHRCGVRRLFRLVALSIPPCLLVSFSTSPSIVLAPCDCSSSSGVIPAIVTPLEPPMRGLLFKSASVGFFVFGCLVMVCLNTAGASAGASSPTPPRARWPTTGHLQVLNAQGATEFNYQYPLHRAVSAVSTRETD